VKLTSPTVEPVPPIEETRGVSHCGLAIDIKKYLKAKEELLETQMFHHAKI